MVIEGCPIHYSVKAAMFFGSPEHLKILRYEVLSPQRRYTVGREVSVGILTEKMKMHSHLLSKVPTHH